MASVATKATKLAPIVPATSSILIDGPLIRRNPAFARRGVSPLPDAAALKGASQSSRLSTIRPF